LYDQRNNNEEEMFLPCWQFIHERVHFPLTEGIQIHHAEVYSDLHISQMTGNMPDRKSQYKSFPFVHPYFGFTKKNNCQHT
jgi:hypothetical protein